MYGLDPGLDFSTSNRDQRRGRFLLPPLLLALAVISLLAVSVQPLLSWRGDALKGRESLASEPIVEGRTPLRFVPEARQEPLADALPAGELCASREASDYAACTSSSPSRQQLLKQKVQHQRVAEEGAEAAEAVVMATAFVAGASAAAAAEAETGSAASRRHVRIRDELGRVTVARLLGREQDGVVELPDGRLGFTKGELAFTEDSFVPLTGAELAKELAAREFPGFKLEQTSRYLVFSQASKEFTKATANLLESLNEGLMRRLREQGLVVHEAEFPLVAVIFRDQEAFREHREVPEDVLAYYEVISNRIYLYETSERDLSAPDMAALRKPQTVAHEGTHQLLQNIGIQPRLAEWPIWLVEGLAEYFAPTSVSRSGQWRGGNHINPFHMATLKDLKDPLSLQRELQGVEPPRIGRPAGTSTVEYLATRKELSPTDYSLAWAMTYYLANKRFEPFLEYVKEMSEAVPLEPRSEAEHLATFQKHFPENLKKMDQSIDRYLAGLKGYEALSYYAVTFEQPVGQGIVRRGALVSQSPAMIRQWVDEMMQPTGGAVRWQATPFPTRSRARVVAEQWMNHP